MTRKRKVGVAGIVAALLLGGGVATALWTATGVGTGTAKATSAQQATVNAVTGTADLYPGNTNGDVFFTVTNPNPYPITFTSMTPGTITSATPGCAASLLNVAGATGLSISVAANTTSATQSIADVVSLSSAAPDACQGASFSIALILSGGQA